MFDPEKTSVPSAIGSYASNQTAEVSVPVLVASKNTSNAYDGKDVFLEVEGNQEVFYRGAYVTQIPLQSASLVVGRRDVIAGHYPDIDLAMYRKQDPSISRRHLRIFRETDGSWKVEDLCNHNSTFINNLDTPLNLTSYTLTPGDRIIISSSIAMTFKVR